MWAPSHVVDKHKKRASCIWMLLLALILGYAIWLLVSTIDSRNNPSVSLRLEAGRYPFPTLSICMVAGTEVGNGCDSLSFNCAATATTTVLGGRGFDEYTSTSESIQTENEEQYYCNDIWLSSVSENNEDLYFLPPQISLQVQWAPTVEEGNTDYEPEEFVTEISESVLLYFTDPAIPDPLGDHGLSTFVGEVPYARLPAGNQTTDFIRTSITMGMVESVSLDDDTTKTYFASSKTPINYILLHDYFDEPANIDVGVMIVDLSQPALTHTVRKEVDPLEWAELVGNIGGAWEVFLVLWGVLFVTARRDEPNLKGRNWKKSAQRGTQIVVNRAQSVASMVNRGSQNRPSAGPTIDDEAAPAYETAGYGAAARCQPSAAATPGPAFSGRRTGPAPTYFEAMSSSSTRDQAQSSFFGGARSRQSRAQVQHDHNESYPYPNDVLQSASGKTPVLDDIPRPSLRPL